MKADFPLRGHALQRHRDHAERRRRSGFWYYPVQQSLEAALLQAGRIDEAEQAFTASLTRARNNGWALFGLMKVHEARGDREAAKEAVANLERACAADPAMLDLARL